MAGAVLVLMNSSMSTLKVTLTESGVYGFRKGVGTAFTNANTAVVSGGKAPYTFSWEPIGGTPTTGANSPTAATTRFNTYFSIAPDTHSDMWQCTVTDANSTVVVSDPFSVTLEVLI